MTDENEVATEEVAEEKVVTKKKVTGVTREATIEVLTETNPKREGSNAYDRFEGYLAEEAPTTVAEALDNGLTMGDIHYDFIHGFISVEGAEVIEYTPTKRDASEAAVVDDAAVAEDDGEDDF